MTMAVELRITAITGVLELRSGLNPSGQLVVRKCLQSCHKSHHRVFMCTIRRKNNITSYDVRIGRWLDVEHLLQLVCIGLA